LERARRALRRSDRPETIAFHRINREAKMSGIEQIVALQPQLNGLSFVPFERLAEHGIDIGI
jgi:hypothetical protein